MLDYSVNYAKESTAKAYLNNKVNQIYPKLGNKSGVKLGHVWKNMLQIELKVNMMSSWINRASREIIFENHLTDALKANNAL